MKAIERELLRDKHVMRYASEDDFGLPGTAFLICRFWRIDVLWDSMAGLILTAMQLSRSWEDRFWRG